jgi:uncharacterized protein (DUF58 family)
VGLLSAEFLQRLGRLALASRTRQGSTSLGERRSNRRGQSQEFADHRPYVPGDDLRFLDWHVYGRLDALWIRLFEDEQDRVVQLLVDCSGSMEGEKLDQARKIAAAISVVALGRADRVAVGAFDDRLRVHAPGRRGRQSMHAVFQTIEGIHPGGETDLVRGIEGWPRQRGAGIALLFTDFLHPEGPEAPLRRLLARGLEVHVFHVIAPAEIRPNIDGDLMLVDRETGEEMAVTVDEDAIARYERHVRAWMDGIEGVCRGLGVGYVRALTSVPVEEIVLRDLRRLGLVQ